MSNVNHIPPLAELAAKAPRPKLTWERILRIVGDPCGSVFMCPDKQKMLEQLTRKIDH
jgi:hypothetical protein